MSTYLPLVLSSLLWVVASTSVGGCSSSPDDNLLDRQALQACSEESSCPQAFAQLAEGSLRITINRAECLLTALRDRTEGIYEIELDHTFSSGSVTDQHLFVITPTGHVERSVASRVVDGLEGFSETTYEPTQRCAPKPASFFSACLEELAATDPEDPNRTDGAWECVLPGRDGARPLDLPWFEDCTEQPPSCE